MSGRISSIGPLTIPAMIEPFSLNVAAQSGPASGVPITAQFGLASRYDAEILEELCNNPARSQAIGNANGVLEWVVCTGALDRYTGWWLIEGCSVGYSRRQTLASNQLKSYVPVSIGARFLGVEGHAVVAATHRAIPNDFSLTGQPLTVPLYPSIIPGIAHNSFARPGESDRFLRYYLGATKRMPTRIDGAQFVPATSTFRPHLRDVAGRARFGPPRGLASASGVRFENGFIRVTIGAAVHWTFEAWVSSAWATIGTLGVSQTGAAASWVIAGTEFTDDRVAVLLVDDWDGSTVRVELRAGELGLRVVAADAQRFYLQWWNPDGSGVSGGAQVSNYYQDGADQAWGGRRFLAVARSVAADDPSGMWILPSLGHPSMAGFRFAGATGNNTVVELAKQFLYDRDEQLVLE